MISWCLAAAGALSVFLAFQRTASAGMLGIPGLALLANAGLCFSGAFLVRRASAARGLESEARSLRERARFLEERAAGLQAQVELLSAMRELSRAPGGETRLEPVAAEIVRIVGGLLAPEGIALCMPQDDHGLRPVALDGPPPDPAALAAAWGERRIHRQGRHVAVPLASGEAVIGVLAVRMPSDEGAETAERMLRDLAKHIALSLMHPNLRNAAMVDALTGLFTKRHLLENAPALVARQHARGGRLALLMADLDHFKRINDTYGHPAGDAVLREVSRRLQAAIRGTDSAYRYGGEEMACLLPGASGALAMRVANRIHREVAAAPVPLGDGREVAVTVSLGVAALTAEMTTWEALVSAADQALYQAKEAGRDRVVAFRERR